MDNLKKNLAARKKERKDLQAALNELYREYGAAQFGYALQHGAVQYIAGQDFETWKTLQENRRQDADTILNIRMTLSRQNELQVFCKGIDKLLREQHDMCKNARRKFLLLFFQTYRHDSLPCIAQIIQEITPLKEAVEKLQEERQMLERQKDTAHFLKKLTIRSQLLSLKGKLTGLQKKMEESIIDSADIILTDALVNGIRENAPFPESLEAAYSELQSISVKRQETEHRKQTLNAEREKLQQVLTEYDADDAPQKRITLLTNQIKKADEAIEDSERQQGILYGNVFYTDKGESTGEVFTDIPELFRPYLNSIGEYRTKLEKNKLTIEYIENELILTGEIRKIEALQKAILVYKDGIAQYEQLIAAAEQDILRTEEMKATYEKKKSELSSLL